MMNELDQIKQEIQKNYPGSLVLKNHPDYFNGSLSENVLKLQAVVRQLSSKGELDFKDIQIPVVLNMEYREIPYMEVLEYYNKLLQRDSFVPQRKNPDPSMTGRVTTIIIGDLHAPNHRHDLFIEISKKYEGCDLVINGDLFDFSRLSKWSKTARKYYRDKELQQDFMTCARHVAASIESLSHYWRDIRFIRGNHDERLAKTFAAAFARPEDGPGVADFLLECLLKEANVRCQVDDITNLRCMQLGDCWIGHFDCCGKAPLHGGRAAVDWVMDNPRLFTSPWTTLIQGHTHKTTKGKYRGKLVIEGGSLMEIPDYNDEQAGKWVEPSLGYVELVQYDGITDWEETRLITIDENAPNRRHNCTLKPKSQTRKSTR